MVEVQCNHCSKIFLKYSKKITKKNFCNKECMTKWRKGKSYVDKFGLEAANKLKEKLSKSLSGENNPNFGNFWSDEQKQQQSDTIKIVMADMGEDVRKELFGKSNRGKKRSKEFIENWQKTRKDPNYIRPETSLETRSKIGKISSERMNSPKMQAHYRKINEEAGRWIPLDLKSDAEIYFKLANWKFRMWDLIENPFQLDLIKEFGVFNCRTNTKGVVRDHIFSRKEGFLIGLFPEILRHPCNCQILTHSDNVRKKKKRYEDKSDISLEQLFFDIENYKKEWDEQELILSLINSYKEGKRWIYQI